jgi:hypothetical protein
MPLTKEDKAVELRNKSLTREARETVITFDDLGSIATITTHSRSILPKLEKNPQATKVQELTYDGIEGAEFEMPKHMLSFRTVDTRKSKTGGKLR